jgi:hypothetical protein
MAKTIAAIGGGANLRSHGSIQIVVDYDFENMGITAQATTTSLLPDGRSAMQIMFFGMGKEIGSVRTDCIGTE